MKYLCTTDPWPEPVARAFKHLNTDVYNTMQGPNEFVVTGNLKEWNRWNDLQKIMVPTLLIVGRQDTMAVEDIQKMGQLIPNSRVVVCENGSHICMYDDQQTYFYELLKFIKDVETDRFVK